MPTLLAPAVLSHHTSAPTAGTVGRLLEHANDACYDASVAVERLNHVTATARQLAWSEDFLNNGLNGSVFQASASGGSFTAGTGEAGHPGVCNLNTGTGTTGAEQVRTAVTSFLFGGGSISLEWCIRIPNLSTVGDEFIFRCGFWDTSFAAAADGAYIEYDRLNSTNWRYITASNSTRTSTNSSTAVPANTWTKLRVDMNAAGSSVSFYADGALLGTTTTNIPTGAGRETGMGAMIVKSAGTTARTADLDYVWVVQQFTTAR